MHVLLPKDLKGYTDLDPIIIRCLDSALYSFARWQVVDDDPDWYVVGQRLFAAKAEMFNLTSGYISQRGFFASLKSC